MKASRILSALLAALLLLGGTTGCRRTAPPDGGVNDPYDVTRTEDTWSTTPPVERETRGPQSEDTTKPSYVPDVPPDTFVETQPVVVPPDGGVILKYIVKNAAPFYKDDEEQSKGFLYMPLPEALPFEIVILTALPEDGAGISAKETLLPDSSAALLNQALIDKLDSLAAAFRISVVQQTAPGEGTLRQLLRNDVMSGLQEYALATDSITNQMAMAAEGYLCNLSVSRTVDTSGWSQSFLKAASFEGVGLFVAVGRGTPNTLRGTYVTAISPTHPASSLLTSEFLLEKLQTIGLSTDTWTRHMIRSLAEEMVFDEGNYLMTADLSPFLSAYDLVYCTPDPSSASGYQLGYPMSESGAASVFSDLKAFFNLSSITSQEDLPLITAPSDAKIDSTTNAAARLLAGKDLTAVLPICALRAACGNGASDGRTLTVMPLPAYWYAWDSRAPVDPSLAYGYSIPLGAEGRLDQLGTFLNYLIAADRCYLPSAYFSFALPVEEYDRRDGWGKGYGSVIHTPDSAAKTILTMIAEEYTSFDTDSIYLGFNNTFRSALAQAVRNGNSNAVDVAKRQGKVTDRTLDTLLKKLKQHS